MTTVAQLQTQLTQALNASDYSLAGQTMALLSAANIVPSAGVEYQDLSTDALSGLSAARDLGDITGLTSAQIDALFTVAPVNGALATAVLSAAPVVLGRRGGKWNYASATLIA